MSSWIVAILIHWVDVVCMRVFLVSTVACINITKNTHLKCICIGEMNLRQKKLSFVFTIVQGVYGMRLLRTTSSWLQQRIASVSTYHLPMYKEYMPSSEVCDTKIYSVKCCTNIH